MRSVHTAAGEKQTQKAMKTQHSQKKEEEEEFKEEEDLKDALRAGKGD